MASCYMTGHATENALIFSKEHLAFWINLSCLFFYIIFVRSNLCTHDPTLSDIYSTLCFCSIICVCIAKEHNGILFHLSLMHLFKFIAAV